MQRNTLARASDTSNTTLPLEIRKQKVTGTLEFLHATGIPHVKADVYRFHGITLKEGHAIDKSLKRKRGVLAESSDDEESSSPRRETRGRKHLLGWPEIHSMERIIAAWGQEHRELSWKQLAEEAELTHVSMRTIQKAIGTLEFFQCAKCKKGYVNPNIAAQRNYFASQMLWHYPLPENWKAMRFSDEMHWGISREKLFPLRKPGVRLCAQCVEVGSEGPEGEMEVEAEDRAANREHGWGAVGYGFKSELLLYDTKAQDGKMSQDVYIQQILTPIIKKWQLRGHDFVLCEEPELGHGSTRTTYPWDPTQPPPRNKRDNDVQKWKRENPFNSYYNSHAAPDLTPIGIANCWRAPTVERLKELVVPGAVDEKVWRNLTTEGWDAASQEVVDNAVLSMPQRLADCIALEGQLTGW
jgi:hypothetical protein